MDSTFYLNNVIHFYVPLYEVKIPRPFYFNQLTLLKHNPTPLSRFDKRIVAYYIWGVQENSYVAVVILSLKG